MAFHKHDRRSIRLAGYDYSNNGAYFITICVRDRIGLLGKISNTKFLINELGKIVLSCWRDLPNHYKNIKLDAFTIMPDHMHGIIIIGNTNDCVGAGLKPAPTSSNNPHTSSNNPHTSSNNPAKLHGLSEIVRGFKTFSAKRINEFRNMRGAPVWQRNYFERVIRNEYELERTRRYIDNNAINHIKNKEVV